MSSSDLAVVNVAPFLKTLFVNTIPVSGDPFALETEVRCMASGWGEYINHVKLNKYTQPLA